MDLTKESSNLDGLSLNLKDKIPFGKYKNSTVEEVGEIDANYLRWLVENTNLLFHSEVERRL